MKRLLLLACIIFATSSLVFGDIARPKAKNAKAIDAMLSIRIDATAKEARLRIPKSQIAQLRAQLDEMDGDGQTAASVSSSVHTQTIVSGVLLSLALVFGGVWFARKGKTASKATRAAAVLVGIVASAAFAAFVFANAGPPPDARSITGKLFTPSVHMYKQASGRVKLETSDETDYIELIVPDVKTPPKPGEDE
jgi:hypothetical protein